MAEVYRSGGVRAGLNSDEAIEHWRNGGGETVVIDMYSHMTEGAGKVFSTEAFARAFANATEGLPPGSVVHFETNATIRAETGAAVAIQTYSFYENTGLLSDGSFVWGNTSAGFKGDVTVLGDGRLAVSGEIRPYQEQFDFTANTSDPFLEAARYVGSLWTGPGVPYDIRFEGQGRPVDGTYQLNEFGAFGIHNYVMREIDADGTTPNPSQIDFSGITPDSLQNLDAMNGRGMTSGAGTVSYKDNTVSVSPNLSASIDPTLNFSQPVNVETTPTANTVNFTDATPSLPQSRTRKAFNDIHTLPAVG